MILIIITIIVVVLIWFLNDKDTINDLQYIAKQQQTQRPPTRKPLSGGQQRPPTRKPSSSGQQRPPTRKPSSSGQQRPTTSTPKKPPSDSGQGLKYKGVNKPPTYERLKKALEAYQKNNKSGKVDPSSSYADLVQQGYLQFQNGKWVRYLQPAGKPRVTDEPSNQPPSNKQPGNKQPPTKKQPGGGSGGSSGNLSSGGIVNWAWSGESGGSKETHDKTKYQGQSLILLDQGATKDKIKEAKNKVGDKGDIIGYMSVGSIEEYRLANLKEQGYKGPGPSDAAKGPAMAGWQKPGERENWIDINNWEKAMPFIKGQIDFMKQRGFTAIEADNMSIDKNCKNKECRDKNIQFAKAVAKVAHDSGMKILMKNGSEFADVDPNYMKQLAQTFDGIITEQANQYNDTEYYKPFAEAGKPWYNFEYENRGKNCKTVGGQTDTYFQTSSGWQKC